MIYKTKEIRKLLKEFHERYGHLQSRIKWTDAKSVALPEFKERIEALGGYRSVVIALGRWTKYEFGKRRLVFGKTKMGFYNYITLQNINRGYFCREERSTDEIYTPLSTEDETVLKNSYENLKALSTIIVDKYIIKD